MPLLSIIVPVYNAESTINRCVDSIISQSFKDFEVILVDDGSFDSSGEICDQYVLIDERIKVVHKVNGGVSSARNYGLALASGKFIAFADSDDWASETWLSDFSSHTIFADLWVQSFISEGVNSSLLSSRSVDYFGNAVGAIQEMVRANNLGYLWDKLFSTAIIRRYHLKFDENKYLMEDEDFVIRYIYHCDTVCILPVKNYHYIVPVFIEKYDNSHNYQPLERVKSIMAESSISDGAHEVISFLSELLVTSICQSYNNGAVQDQSILAQSKNYYQGYVCRVVSLSIVTRTILSLPPSVAHVLMRIKSKWSNYLH